jgi:hypothetical protein
MAASSLGTCSLGWTKRHVLIIGYKVGVDVVVRHFVPLMAVGLVVEVDMVDRLFCGWHQDLPSAKSV